MGRKKERGQKSMATSHYNSKQYCPRSFCSFTIGECPMKTKTTKKGGASNPLQKYFKNTERVITLLKKDKEQHGLILYGGKGIGKTTTISNAIKNNNHVIVRGKITPYQLFKLMYDYRHPNDYIVLDDVIPILKDDNSMAILLAALETNEGARSVQWLSSKPAELSGFEYAGKMIIIINNLPQNLAIKPLENRCFVYNLCFSWRERLSMLEDLRDSGHIIVGKEEATEIIDWFKCSSSKFNKNKVNLRNFKQVQSVYKEYPRFWKRIVRKLKL